MVVVLPVFWSMGQLDTWWRPPLNAVVYAVMLAVSLPRALVPLRPGGLLGATAALLAGAICAVGCGMLLAGTNWYEAAGAVVFALGVAVPVWLRRFGPAWRTAGTIAAIPFLAVLVHPLPDEKSWSFLGWMLLASVMAYAWAASIHILTASEPPPPATPSPARSRRVAPSTRMAIQLALAVGATIAFGQWTDPDHLVWPVLTALIVHSANRSRGDVLWKGAERTIGALIGTIIATWLAGALAPGDSVAIVALFAILALAAGLREISYVYRAACTTSALAFLYGYFGQTGSNLLAHRLLGVLAGSIIGAAAAWFVLPVRTTDITRLRVGALLAAASDVATSAAGGRTDHAALSRLAGSDRELAALTPTVRAARRFGLGPARRLDNSVTHARSLANSATTLATRTVGPDDTGHEFADLTRQINHARRSLRESEG